MTLTTDPAAMQRDAVLSDDGLYRYHLGRSWGPGPSVTWVMLNPSTADHEIDDPTIRRCIGFSRAWGYGRLSIVNLFALRSPYPDAVKAAQVGGVDIIGPENDDHILTACTKAQQVMCAWGAQGIAVDRARDVLGCLALYRLLHRTRCLGRTAGGMPKHPLYIKATTEPEVFP